MLGASCMEHGGDSCMERGGDSWTIFFSKSNFSKWNECPQSSWNLRGWSPPFCLLLPNIDLWVSFSVISSINSEDLHKAWLVKTWQVALQLACIHTLYILLKDIYTPIIIWNARLYYYCFDSQFGKKTTVYGIPGHPCISIWNLIRLPCSLSVSRQGIRRLPVPDQASFQGSQIFSSEGEPGNEAMLGEL